MIIREADLQKDALAIADGAREFARNIAFRHLLPEKDEDFVAAVSKVAALEGLEILLAEDSGQVVGGIGILYAPYFWNPEKLVADELFWFAFPGGPPGVGKLLIDEAMRRVRDKGAIPMFRSLVTSPPGVEKTYRRFGLEPVETVFTSRA